MPHQYLHCVPCTWKYTNPCWPLQNESAAATGMPVTAAINGHEGQPEQTSEPDSDDESEGSLEAYDLKEDSTDGAACAGILVIAFHLQVQQ